MSKDQCSETRAISAHKIFKPKQRSGRLPEDPMIRFRRGYWAEKVALRCGGNFAAVDRVIFEQTKTGKHATPKPRVSLTNLAGERTPGSGSK
jgi:hypothetical protein